MDNTIMKLTEEEERVVKKHFDMEELTEDEEYILNDVKNNLLYIVYGE